MTAQDNSTAGEWNLLQIQRSVEEGAIGKEAARPVRGSRRLHELKGGGSSMVRFIDSAYPRSSPARFRLILLY